MPNYQLSTIYVPELIADKKVKFGATSKGKQSVIHKQYEFVKHREYANGTIQWRCRLYQKSRCHARLTTKGHDIVSDCDPEHNRGGNKESALAHLAVNEIKEKMGELWATPTAAIGSVSMQLQSGVLMALLKKPTLKRALQRERRRLQTAFDYLTASSDRQHSPCHKSSTRLFYMTLALVTID